MAKEGFTALLGKGTEYQGNLTFKGAVRIDGRFQGKIVSEGKLILGKDAQVEGTVSVSELVVHGSLKGEITVTNRSMLHETARIVGTLTTPLLAMEEGAVLQGDLNMNKELEASARSHSLPAATEHPLHALDSSLEQ